MSTPAYSLESSSNSKILARARSLCCPLRAVRRGVAHRFAPVCARLWMGGLEKKECFNKQGATAAGYGV